MIKSHSSYADNTRTYVLKIWLEEEEADDGHVVWRGQITNVITREPIHVQTLAAIVTFLEAELEALHLQNQ